MRSVTLPSFWKNYRSLPAEVQKLIAKDYQLWSDNPFHPGLHYKRVHDTKPVFSVRCGLAYRALGVREKDAIIWFWVGHHADYDRLIKKL